MNKKVKLILPVKRATAFIVTLMLVVSCVTFSISAASTVIKQNDSVWKNYTYGTGTLYDTGCGMFSFANAINYGNGSNVVDVPALASWAKSIGAYNKTGNEGTYRDVLYANVEAKYGSTYNFRVIGTQYASVASSALKNHLAQENGVAVAHVSNHFIAIVDYKSSTNQFRVFESYVSSTRTLTAGDSWVSESTLNSSNTTAAANTKVDWFALLTVTPPAPPSSLSYYPKYTGTSTSLTVALDAVGVDSSFANREKIAAVNSIQNYTGTADQNTAMLNKLKAGTLIKTAAYFSKYTGTSTSITTALSEMSIDSSYAYREKIAAANGISGYTGTATQNTQMLDLLKAGTLVKP